MTNSIWVLSGLGVALPAILIFVRGWLLAPRSRIARIAYRVTGLVGAPVHELSHVAACLLFRMPISKVVLYQPLDPLGRLGYVSFMYDPKSTFHAFGRLAQGIAPLLTGAVIAMLVLGVEPVMPRLDASEFETVTSVASAAIFALESTAEQFAAGPLGAVLMVGLMAVCLHALPSIEDLRIGLGGLMALLVVLVVVLLLLSFSDASVASSAFLSNVSAAFHFLLWKWSVGVAVVGMMFLLTSAVLLILPNLFSLVFASRAKPTGTNSSNGFF